MAPINQILIPYRKILPYISFSNSNKLPLIIHPLKYSKETYFLRSVFIPYACTDSKAVFSFREVRFIGRLLPWFSKSRLFFLDLRLKSRRPHLGHRGYGRYGATTEQLRDRGATALARLYRQEAPRWFEWQWFACPFHFCVSGS